MSEDRPIRWVQVVLALVIVGLGFGVVVAFKKSAPEPQQSEQENRGLLVQTQQVHVDDHDVHVRAQGQVMAARRVVLSPQVAGKITWVSDALVPGGRVPSNTRLLRLDGRDYALALQSRSADVNRASLELQLEQRRQAIAEREWNNFGTENGGSGDANDPGRALALRQPQVENAEVSVEAAQSAVQQARLNLQRTTIRAPFNAMVLSESVDVGQYVAPGSQLATLVGTDEAWVQVSLPVEALPSITFPEGDEGEGSPAEVRFDVGGQEVLRQGRVLRLLPDLDASGGMARILVAIEDPFALEREGADAPKVPLLLGSFVTVDIDVPWIRGAVEVPRLAVREGGKVYVMNAEDQLEIRDLRIVWGRADSVLVREGLNDGDRVIISRVPTPVNGMALREETGPETDLRAEAAETSAR
ncbi:MAG: efflux RND transporter periplasmic adaptor subunit [Deltaproteobacteria bacterium]|nr:efflux RND transporter periplasmic adaptor subunit [Deltaproteobacteria bacterium]